MCGIVACVRHEDSVDVLLSGLRTLEYRGYDSAGIAVSSPGGQLQVRRAAGPLSQLAAVLVADPPAGSRGIGHTRWATHGGATRINAHPHVDCSRSIAVVHNGIIENSDALRRDLMARGHDFGSQVDSEVIAHLIEEGRRAGQSLRQAVWATTSVLQGSWALAVMETESPVVLLAAHRCPLAVAIGPDGVYAASDVAALSAHAEEVYYLSNDVLVELGDSVRWWQPDGVECVPPPVVAAPRALLHADVGTHADFMSKEIGEQAEVAEDLIGRLAAGVTDGSLWRQYDLPPFDRVRFLGCGSSLYAASAVARVLRNVGGVPTELVIASEFREHVHEAGTLSIAMSQSGETADVLRALEDSVGPMLAITNAPYSSLARRGDAVLDLTVGPEIGVAATKTVTAQVVAGSALVLSALAAAGASRSLIGGLVDGLRALPQALAASAATAAPIAAALAVDLASSPGFIFVSRGGGLPYAMEGALKLKEISYRWTEAQPAGELKHGPIALIEAGTPVVVIGSGESAKLAASIAECSARGARIVTVGADRQADFPVLSELDLTAPWGPLPALPALQHLARSIALELGCNVDRPRNLAKSVTVE